MSGQDPERLLAEALRAQAVRAPVHIDSGTTGSGVTGSVVTGSGATGSGAIGQDADEEHPVEDTAELDEGRSPAWWWVALVALILGSATGGVIALATLV